jgi:hypothetical protein
MADNEIRRISTRDDLVALANELGVRSDWHEPDNQGVTAEVRGASFDNAGFWGIRDEADSLARHGHGGAKGVEMYVVIHQEDGLTAEINLATLFSWASWGR